MLGKKVDCSREAEEVFEVVDEIFPRKALCSRCAKEPHPKSAGGGPAELLFAHGVGSSPYRDGVARC